ncbi:hypothetical protein [Streptomyces sp. NPDC058045]|uniref:hypothetical protein n=1 Tax=Streptomyces sp. NPDC058045 TaxID=3346311 RepID=UPI0036E9644F
MPAGKGSGSGSGGKRSRPGDVPGLEAMLDELYSVPPSDFVTRRAELAAAAARAGRREDARALRVMRRPTLAAWAANRLVRRRPEECRRFLELGVALREAYRTLDGARLRELSGRQSGVVAALAAQAGQLAEEAGRPLAEPVRREVESTLRAVLADQEAADQWAAGRLTVALVPPTTLPSAPSAPSAPPSAEPAAQTGDELAVRRRAREEALAKARTRAEAAQRQLARRREEKTAAEAALARAREGRERAEREVAEADQRLRRARTALREADEEQRAAETGVRAAGEAVSGARLEAREAADEVRRLTARRSPRRRSDPHDSP